ncbi:MAG: hypothetical protein JSS75_08840 [Bacteroidetes bacterium]|nr:hypothetical protein [Bacteroidota bacterium]
MKLKLFAIPLIAAALIGTGCGKKEDKAQEAADAAQKAAQQMAQQTAPAAAGGAHTPGVVIPAKTLAGALVAPSGYTIEGEPETMEMDLQGQKWSHANATYKNGEKTIKIGIYDYNYITGLSTAYSAMMNMNMESNDESMHTDKIGGFPAWVDWKKKSNQGTIGVIVNDRVFVVTEGHTGTTLDEIKAAASGINYSAIASATK